MKIVTALIFISLIIKGLTFYLIEIYEAKVRWKAYSAQGEKYGIGYRIFTVFSRLVKVSSLRGKILIGKK